MDVVSTAGIPARERFAFWREVSAKLWSPLDARCDRHLEGVFRARGSFGGLGLMRSVLLTSTPLWVHRTPKLIRQADPEAFVVTCAARGHVMAEQDNRQAELRDGDLTLRDSSRPYLTRFAPRDQTGQALSVQFPRSSLPLPERDLRKLTALRIPGDQGVGALASQFLLQLARRIDQFSPADTARVSTLALDVLTATLASALETQSAVPPHTRQRALLAQIHAFIQANLGDADLTPDAIAAAHHISVRYLHQLFHDQGHTVAAWIRQRRLQHCHRDLADPRLATQPITVIAARWGFTSPSHFSQAFRAAYGLSPRQFRRQCATVHAD